MAGMRGETGIHRTPETGGRQGKRDGERKQVRKGGVRLVGG
jgi:hypothetical protein